MLTPVNKPTDPLDMTVWRDPNDTDVPASTAKFLLLLPIVISLLPYLASRLTSDPPVNVTDVIVNPRPFTTDCDPTTISVKAKI